MEGKAWPLQTGFFPRYPFAMKRTLLTFLLILFAGVTLRAQDIFSDEQVAKELSQLRNLPPRKKALVRQAVVALRRAFESASVSTDLEEIAGNSTPANRAVDAASAVMPDGILKGALNSCKKALGHSYILRLVKDGGLDPREYEVSRLLAEIMIRYQLARIPEYERPAKVLDFAEMHLTIAKRLASEVGILTETRLRRQPPRRTHRRQN